MRNSTKKRWAGLLVQNLAAYHEAGHFVLNEQQGNKIIFATARPFQGGRGCVLAELKSTEPINVARRKLAGIAAEVIKFPHKRSNLGETDYDELKSSYTLEVLHDALNDAEKILFERMPRLEQVAQTLLEHGCINGKLEPCSEEEIEEARNMLQTQDVLG
jgi:hypothetical protein